ncbi:MAG: AAA family ATPase [Bacilli bacterium]|nr:AAA family ATPase [Bacilli bacterium]
MKLLSIKAHGFKSFADTIEIQVNDGITGIVGPNGSGKSNVVDAVRWVLGESSLKEIRSGDSMTDVIFMGSSSREKQNHAWVSLTFDNRDKYLATPYEEVEIKREVYKTGENEYYINNTKVRKKDITDLFLDSGSNPDSFSIISQGKIQDILKGKSSDRRIIIEEAAGVLKYKKRKEETMRKLDNTNNNLEKVSLVINELEVNLNPLKEQAEVATKYLEYKKELQDIEIALLASDIKNINDNYQEKKDRLEKVNEEILNMDNSNSIDNSKLEGLKAKLLKLDEEINEESNKLMKLSEELYSLDSKKQLLQERKKYEVEDQKLENNIINLKNDELDLKKNITVLENSIKDVTQEVKDNKKDEEKLQEELNNLNIKKNTLLDELNKRNRDEFNIKNKIEVLNESIENDSKIPFAVKSVINNPRLSGLHDILIKLIDTEEKYANAIETALGANQNVIVVDKETDASKAIEYLKDNKLGRATFFPISIIKSRLLSEDVIKDAKEVPGYIGLASELVTYDPLYQNIVENQLGNTLVVNNLDSMNKLGKKLDYKYRIITLDGDISHTGGSMTGGFKKQTAGLINIKYELDNLYKDLSTNEVQIKNIEENLNELDKEINIVEANLFKQKEAYTISNTLLSSRMSELNTYNDRLTKIQDELKGVDNIKNDASDKELDKIMDEYLKISTDKDLTSEHLSKLKNDKNDLSQSIEELEIQNRKINSEYNKKLNETKELEIEIGKMDIKLDNLLNRLSEEYQITYEKAKDDYILDLDEDVARTKVNHLRRNIRDLGDVNVGSIEEYNRINERYTFLTEQRSDLENAINDLMQVITDLDETMKVRFKETFDKVNEEFGKVFKQLFKGGSASLSLTNPDDYLNTGVDISACPPGKNLKSINTLSGGENTLTAIALLFSILNIRLIPFVILDEVEAALDDNNVDTFCTYLKNYENHTQFIVITHKKRTMEYANNLYGITMQESGVSKLVSVKLENI